MSANIKVAVRVRPFTSQQLNQDYVNNCIQVDKRHRQIRVSQQSEKSYTSKEYNFDCVLTEKAGQQDVYRGCGIDYLVSKATQGYNSTIFLYGQTGSGKTYTMQGRNVNEIGDGIVPRVIASLYEKIKQNNKKSFRVSVSYLQVYSQKVYDLLNPIGYSGNKTTFPPNLRLRWSKENQFTVENLFVFECSSSEELLQYVKQGLTNRVNATHRLNISSSRSHSILTLRVDSCDREDPSNTLTSRIELVDLAGSQRTNQTGSEGRLAKQSIDINRSLFTLRQVITTLAEDPQGHIPYRESKLTSLLKHSIGGNCYCLMIACISPNDLFLDENLSTLAYATKASQIKNEPIVNKDPQHQHIVQLQNQINDLNKELQKANRNNEISKQVVSAKGDMDEFLERAGQQIQKMEKDKPKGGASKGDSYWHMLVESVNMVRDLLKNNRELREQTQRYKILLDKRDLQMHEMFKENEEFRNQLHKNTVANKALFKKSLKNPKTEHLKTDYSFYQTQASGSVFVPIVAMLSKSRNKCMLNTFTSSTEIQPPGNKNLAVLKQTSKRQTRQSFNNMSRVQAGQQPSRVRAQSSNDHYDRCFLRRTFKQMSSQSPNIDKRLLRMMNS